MRIIKGVSLVSGGLDSTLMAVLLREQGFNQIPLFIDYGQLAAGREWQTCDSNFSALSLPSPIRMDLSGYGKVISCGITSISKRLVEDAFLPGRNMLFLTAGAAFATNSGGTFVSIGLLDEKFAIFADQKEKFLKSLERTLALALGKDVKILAPLFDFSKADVIILARRKGIDIERVYSCHAGLDNHCGQCISCRERGDAMEVLKRNESGGK